MAVEVRGDLLTITLEHNTMCNYICHQTNCTSTYAKGLAKHIFDKFPNANTYCPGFIRTLGCISIHGNVINMYAQLYPGKPRSRDNKTQRLNAFRQCLKQIAEIDELGSIAFPHRIGCGLAGGNWAEYKALIDKFAESVDATVYIVNNTGYAQK